MFPLIFRVTTFLLQSDDCSSLSLTPRGVILSDLRCDGDHASLQCPKFFHCHTRPNSTMLWVRLSNGWAQFAPLRGSTATLENAGIQRPEPFDHPARNCQGPSNQ